MSGARLNLGAYFDVLDTQPSPVPGWTAIATGSVASMIASPPDLHLPAEVAVQSARLSFPVRLPYVGMSRQRQSAIRFRELGNCLLEPLLN
jgi:hypothetical protein